MNETLMRAILAMDTYNRGYNASIILTNNSIGKAQIKTVTASNGSQVILDSGIITNSSNPDDRLDEDIDFYALAYDYNGKTVISYRGTDNLTRDFYHGYGVGFGLPDADQGEMAFEFYNLVAYLDNNNTAIDPRLANISVTGHSLGGGLAGLVGATYNKNGDLFDNMRFEAAAMNIETSILGNSNFSNIVYRGLTPWDAIITDDVDTSKLHTYSLNGELLDFQRNLQITPETEYSLPGNPVLDPSLFPDKLEAHSIAGLIIHMFSLTEVNSSDWEYASPYFWPVLFDNSFAQHIGAADSSKLNTKIAYSAIDEGTRVFGDTAIRALYNDANDLGEGLKEASHLHVYAEDVSKIFVHYAGLLALNKIEYDKTAATTHLNVNEGILDYQDGHLDINFSDAMWGVVQDLEKNTSIFSMENFMQRLTSDTGVETSLRHFLDITNGSSDFNTIQNIILKNSNTYGFTLADTYSSIVAGSKTSAYVGTNTADAINLRVRDAVIFGQGGNDLIEVDNVDGYYFIDGGNGYDTLKFYSPNDFFKEEATNEIVSSSGRIIFENIEKIENPPKTLVKNSAFVTPNPDRVYDTYDYTAYDGNLSIASGDHLMQGIYRIMGTHNGDTIDVSSSVKEVHLGYGDDVAYQSALITNSFYLSPIFVYYGGDDTIHLHRNDQQANLAKIVLNDTIVLDDITFGNLHVSGSDIETTIYIANHGSLRLTNLPINKGIFINLMTGGGLRVEYNSYADILETEKIGDTLNPLYHRQNGTWGDDVWYARHPDKNTYFAFGGDDIFHLKEGSDDIIYAGEGIDRAIFSGNSKDYELIIDKGFLLVKKGSEMNALLGAEFIQFNDVSYEVSLLNSQKNILYSEGRVFLGTLAIDYIEAGAETINAYVSTYSGNDTITTGFGDDFIHAGKGEDKIYSGAGDDTYFWNIGDGYDKIYANAGFDTLQFGSDILPEDVTITYFNDYRISTSNELKISINSNGSIQYIKVIGQYDEYGEHLERILFDNGEEIDLIEVKTLLGTNGNDRLNGTLHDEILISGSGNDIVSGQGGQDIYVYTAGDDIYQIFASPTYYSTHPDLGNAKIKMDGGINYGDLSYVRNNNDLLISIADRGSITITNQYNNLYDTDGLRFSEIILSNGHVISMDKLPYTYYGTDSHNYPDNLIGTDASERFITYAGNDTIDAGSGDDEIDGGDGRDTIYGGPGNDRIYGGKGNDLIFGETGNDISVYDFSFYNYKIDQLNSYQHYKSVGSTYFITFVTEYVPVAPNQYSSFQDSNIGIEKLEFSDGIFNVTTGIFTSFPDVIPAIDFSSLYINSYTQDQDIEGYYNTNYYLHGSNEGRSLFLYGNTWKKAHYNYTITEKTILEFEFRINNEGDIHSIGFDTDNIHNNGDVNFWLGGTNSSSSYIKDIGSYSSNNQWVKYTIEAGNYFQGNISYLTFINDDDSNSLNQPQSAFRNVRLFEEGYLDTEPTPPSGSIYTYTDGVTLNGLSNSSEVNTGVYLEKTHAMSFETGSDVTSLQVLYEQGGGSKGLNLFIQDGALFGAVWNRTSNGWGYHELSSGINANTKYTAALVMDGTSSGNGTLALYVNGEQVGSVSGIGELTAHGDNIGIGQVNGSTVINNATTGSVSEFSGSIEKIIHYNSALGGNDLGQLNEYMGHEWVEEITSSYEAPAGSVYLFEDGVTASVLDSDNQINTGVFAAKTQGISFKTGSDVQSLQVLYEQGGGGKGLNMFIEGGMLYGAVWDKANWGYKEVKVAIEANTTYTSSLIMDGTAAKNGILSLYLNGSQVDNVGGVGILGKHTDDISIGSVGDKTSVHTTNISADSPFSGSIEKIVQYNEALSGSILSDLHNYLGNSGIVEPPVVTERVVMEFGSVSANHSAVTVNLDHDFDNPVIFMTMTSTNGGAVAVPRITDVQGDRFTFYAQEADYLDGYHATEMFSYIVVEKGAWELSDGTRLEVGTADIGQLSRSGFVEISFATDFDNSPAVFSQIQTNHDPDFVGTRQKSTSNNGFMVSLQEEDLGNSGSHDVESVGWFAIETGAGSDDGFEFYADQLGDAFTHDFSDVLFKHDFDEIPQLLAQISSYDGSDASFARAQSFTADGVKLKVQEDQSKDTETDHTTESFDIFTIEGSGQLTGVINEVI